MLVTLVFTMQAAGLILGPLFASALLSTHLSHDIIWRILMAFGAAPALAVYWQRRHLRETPRYLAAGAKHEDDAGQISNAAHFDKSKHSVSFWDGFHRLVNDNKLLLRLVGTSAAWFLMDAAYYGNTVSSPTRHGISAAIGKLGGFLGVFLFPFLMQWKGLLGAESAAALASIVGLIVTSALLPETKGKSLEAI